MALLRFCSSFVAQRPSKSLSDYVDEVRKLKRDGCPPFDMVVMPTGANRKGKTGTQSYIAIAM